MPATRTVLPVLLLLMFSSWSGAVLASNNDSESPSISIPNEAITDLQWSEISVDYESSYDLKKFSGLINSPFGDFDPLVDPIPLGPENLFDSSAIFRTGLVIIQSNGVDMTGLIDLLDLYEIPIIDSIPDSALIVRLPVDDISETKFLYMIPTSNRQRILNNPNTQTHTYNTYIYITNKCEQNTC